MHRPNVYLLSYSLVLLYSLFQYAVAQDLTRQQTCFFRCTANCLSTKPRHTLLILQRDDAVDSCERSCADYGKPDFCSDDACWSTCKDLGPPQKVQTPTGVRQDATNVTVVMHWTMVLNASMYIVEFGTETAENTTNFSQDQYFITRDPSYYAASQNPTGNFCDAYNIRVAAANGGGVSDFSDPAPVPTPTPNISPKLTIVEMMLIDRPFTSDFYQSNGTVEIKFAYDATGWPLGGDDLIVEPLFFLINCAEPDMSQSIPIPEFKQEANSTIVGEIGADMMYRRCRYVYYVQEATSKQCGTETTYHSPPASALQTVNINCDTVTNSRCSQVGLVHPGPRCGFIDNISYKILNHNYNRDSNLTLEVSFAPEESEITKPPLYYIAVYGHAVKYGSAQEEAFLGVNITDIMGQVTNCPELKPDGTCAVQPNNTVVIDRIHFDQLYGITFCSVLDPQNLTIPDIPSLPPSLRPKTNAIDVPSRDYFKSKTGLIIGLVVGFALLILLAILAWICFNIRRNKAKNKMYQMKLEAMEREKDGRYTDMPKKHDIWEIERRNLIIYNEQKLGAGAFGAVYLGKLLGKSLGHKDANSPLGVNIMRAENCEVAVKMLPEYADELSRSEFLREIGLMKTLGYHERLVNMLACITDSEPLCLVVEYCGDGDLLHFMRDRCKYMMKLDDAGINYHEPPVDENYDLEMIITLKQLLMFAVQISYGLEYLSQKGFVHRDVAARNVLVQNKNACKIGDFGLCRYIYSDSSHYKSKGGRLPLKWMSPEAIRHYEFSTKSDVWSFGVLLFEIITLGGSPYPGVQPEDMLEFLERGGRMEQPDNCPDQYYDIMTECWQGDPENRIEFSAVRQKLAGQLEEITEEYSYLKLDAAKDYYNVKYDAGQKGAEITIPEDSISAMPISLNTDRSASTLSLKSEPQLDSARSQDSLRDTPEASTRSLKSFDKALISDTSDVNSLASSQQPLRPPWFARPSISQDDDELEDGTKYLKPDRPKREAENRINYLREQNPNDIPVSI